MNHITAPATSTASPPIVPRNLWQKRIPTVLGMGFLIIGLIVGVVFIGQGGGVFAPRATPETTPKNVRLTNVTDTTFTVSFLTDSPTSGFVKYGTEAEKLNLRAADDRDQLSGTVAEYATHHVTVRNLTPGTTYYYVIGTDSGALFDNNGSVFTVQTARRAGAASAAKTVYGSVTTDANAPASGSVVYVQIDGASDMSTLVTNAGGWALPLSNARTPDGTGYATVTNETLLNISVQGPSATLTAQGSITVAQAQPVPTLVFGKGMADVSAAAQSRSAALSEPQATSTPPTAVPTATPTPTPSPSPTPTPLPSPTPTTSDSARIGFADSSMDASGSAVANPSAAVTVVNLEKTEPVVVTTSQPVITGKAASNVVIKVEVHSENQISTQVTSDANGNFEIDVASLGANLEPGEHTVTYTYTDPVSGQDVTVTKTFTVAPRESAVLAQAATPTPTPTPFGSGNPYPIGDATSSATATNSGTTSSSATATKSGTATRSATVSTASGLPVSGAIGTTLALIFGGLFFIIAGSWSFWISSQFAKLDSRH